MKSTIALIFGIICMPVSAECTKAQSSAEIDVKVHRIENGVKAGGSHGYMDQIIISAPLQVEGIPIAAMELTEGEVSSFWVPVAFETKGGVAQTTISGYKESIKNFEILVHYESKNCNRSAIRGF